MGIKPLYMHNLNGELMLLLEISPILDLTKREIPSNHAIIVSQKPNKVN